MISLDETTKDWEQEGVWKIAPAGLTWIKEGARVRIGEGVSIGAGVRIDEGASIGAGVSIGEGARIGEGASIDAGARIGEWVSIDEWARIGARASIDARARIEEGASIGEGARIGEGASIDEWASIGAQARIGNNATEAIDLGWADGYRKCIAQVNGVAYIGAGCRWVTLADALKHWSGKPNRELTMCLMMAAVHIADYKGWAHGDEVTA